MAAEEVTIRVKVGADTKELESLPPAIQQAIGTIQRAVASGAVNFDQLGAAATASQAAMSGSATQAANTASAMDRAGGAASAAFKAFTMLGQGAMAIHSLAMFARNGSEDFKTLRTSIGNVVDRLASGGKVGEALGNGLKSAGQGASDLGDKVKSAGGSIDLSKAKMIAMSAVGVASMAAIAVAVAGLVVALGGIAVALGTVKTAIALDDTYGAAYDNFTVKVGATGAELDKLTGSLNRVAQNTPTGLTTLGPIMAELSARTGMTGPPLEAMTQQIANLSRITGTDATQNVALLTRTFGDASIPVEKQSAALDVLFKAYQQSGVGVDRLSQLMTQFGAPMRNFGFSFKESAALLARFEQQGVNTELVMGSLRVAGGKFADAGIDMREGLKGAIDQIKNAEDATKATSIAMEVFGARAGPDMADTIRGGKFEIEAYIAAIENNKNTINGASDAILGWREHLQMAKNTIITAVLPAATALADFLASGVDKATNAFVNLLPAITAGLQPIKDWLFGVTAVSDALNPLTGELETVSTVVSGGAIATLKNVFMDVAAGVLMAWDVIKGLIDAIRSNEGLWDALVTGAKTLGAVLGTVIVVALGAVALSFAASAAAMGLFVAAIGQLASNAVAGFEAVKTGAGDLASTLGSTWESIKDGVADLGAGVASAWASMVAAVQGFTSSLSAFLGGAWTLIATTIMGLVTALKNGIVNAWTWISTTVSNIVARLGNWLMQTWFKVVSWVVGIKTKLANAIHKAWTWITTKVGGIVLKLATWLSETWRKIGEAIAKVQDLIGDAIAMAWGAIIGVFKSAGKAIIEGIVGVFTGIVTVVKNAMVAAGGIVERVLSAIAEKISALAGAFGLGGAVGGLVASIKGAAGGLMGTIGGFVDSAIGGIKNGVGNVVDLFADKIGDARKRVADMFGGGPNAFSAVDGGAGDSSEGGSLEGPGADLSGLGGGGGGGAEGEKGWAAPDGMSGGDADGSEWYIDPENGKKIYTSGPKKNVQDAKERGQEAKAGSAAAKKKAAAKKTASEASVAQTIANTAEKVAASIKAGLDAIKELSDTDIPGREVWEPKLAAIEAFIAASLTSFDNLGRGLLSKIGTGEGGEDMMETKEAKAIVGVTAMVGGLLDTMGKSMDFLTKARGAKLPEPGEVDSVLAMAFSLLERIRDRGIELAAVFIGDEGPGESFAIAADGMTKWVDLWAKVTDGALKIGAGAKELASAPAAMGHVEFIMQRLAEVSGRMVEAVRNAIPEDQREEMLALSAQIASAIGAWIGPLRSLGEGAVALKAIPQIPADIGTHIEAFLSEVARISGVFVTGLSKAIASRTGRTEALELSRDVAGTFEAQIGMLAALGGAAKSFRDIGKIPPGVTQQIESFLKAIATIMHGFVVGPGFSLLNDQAGSILNQTVVRAVIETFNSAIAMIAALAANAKSISEIPKIPADAIARIYHTLHTVAVILHGFVVGPGYDLLKDSARSIADLGVVRAVVETLQAGIGLLASVAGLGAQIAASQPLTPAMVAQALAQADMVRAGLVEWAERWAAGFEDIEESVAEMRRRVDPYIALMKDALGAFATAAALKVDEVLPIDPKDVGTAILNATRVMAVVEFWAKTWEEYFTRIGVKLEEQRLLMTTFAAQMKDALGVAEAAAKLAFKDLAPLNPADIGTAVRNAVMVGAVVEQVAKEWAAGLEKAGRKMADVVAETKAFNEVVGPAVDMIGKTNEALLKLGEKVARPDLADAVARLKRYIVMILVDLSAAFDEVESEVGRLKKAGEISAVLSPAAEAISKVLDALSLEKLLKSPLVDTKLRSGVMARAASRRMEALGTQIAQGVRRTVEVLIEGLSGVTVPEGLGDGLDRIASIYERFATVLERIRDMDLGADIASKVATIASAMRELSSAAGSGGGAGGGGSSVGPGERGIGGDVGRGPTGREVGVGQPVAVNIMLDGKVLETLFTSIMPGVGARADTLQPEGVG